MNRRLLGFFCALFLPTAALVVVGSLLAYQVQVQHEAERLERHEATALAQGAASLENSVASASRDVLQLADSYTLRMALTDESPEQLAALAQDFISAVNAKADYERIRWIDTDGRERVVVADTPDGAVVVPYAQLEDKSDRYYFQPALRLKRGGVYVSPMDLEVDKGKIEVPANPVVRIATPVFDAGGAHRGIIVITYRAKALIDRWLTAAGSSARSAVLLNSAGYWLHSTNAADEWGFMFGRNATFGSLHPAVWARIGDVDSAQFTTPEGLWISRTVRPWNGARDYRWIIVSHVPAAELAAESGFERVALAAAVASLLLIGALFSAIAARYWTRRELQMVTAAQREAEEVQATLRLILDNSPDAMMIVDADGVVTVANARAEQVFGCDPGTLVGLGVEALVPPGDRERHRGQRARFIAMPGARAMGGPLGVNPMRRDGAVFPADIGLAPLQIHGMPCVLVTVVDMTERKRAEAEIRELNETLEQRVADRTAELSAAEARVRLLLESSADGLLGVDNDGRITFMNLAARRVLGYDEQQVIGMAADALIAGSDADVSRPRPVLATLRDGQPVGADDQSYRHADGHAVPVMYATRALVQGDRIVGAVVSFVDMTQRRALNAAREAALAEAERLNRARSSFLANMSHEIRTPLNGVLGLAQVGFREAYQRVSAQETFARILESGRLLQAIIDDVLDFARVDAGKLSVESVPVFLGRLAEEALSQVAPTAKAKGIELRAERAPDVPRTCMTDPLRLKQVLINLLSNAVKFTEHGSVTLSVSREGDRLVLAVIDTGIGISEDQQGRIFNAFEQADTSTTRRFGGTGLGLSIAQRITELMGGKIAVHSQTGAGSTFTVRLPLVEPETLPAEEDSANMLKTQRVRRLEGLRVLIAEDNEINQLVMQAMLEPEGPKLTFASDGEQAVDRVKEAGADGFDIVLMDLQMPVMDGYEATSRIKLMAPQMPIVAQTAHVLAETIEQCRAAGMVAHVSKPVDRHQLIDTILRHARVR
jgi:PAS domain S-box-containing protein